MIPHCLCWIATKIPMDMKFFNLNTATTQPQEGPYLKSNPPSYNLVILLQHITNDRPLPSLGHFITSMAKLMSPLNGSTPCEQTTSKASPTLFQDTLLLKQQVYLMKLTAESSMNTIATTIISIHTILITIQWPLVIHLTLFLLILANQST